MRAYATGDGMATLAGDMTAEEAAACYDVIDQLATMAKADGDPRPIGQIRAAIHAMLILRPADHGLPGVTVNLAVSATLEALEGSSPRGGEVNGFPITAAHLRELLRRIGALGLSTPQGGSLTFAITDEHGGCWPPSAPRSSAGSGSRAAPSTRTPTAAAPCSACRRRSMPTSPPSPSGGSSAPATGACRTPNCGQRAGWADLTMSSPHCRAAGRRPARTSVASAGPIIG